MSEEGGLIDKDAKKAAEDQLYQDCDDKILS
jgi:hypothetical protein